MKNARNQTFSHPVENAGKIARKLIQGQAALRSHEHPYKIPRSQAS